MRNVISVPLNIGFVPSSETSKQFENNLHGTGTVGHDVDNSDSAIWIPESSNDNVISEDDNDGYTENPAKTKNINKVNRSIDWYEVLQSYNPKKE